MYKCYTRDYDDDINVLDAAKKVTQIKGLAGINRYVISNCHYA